MLCRAATQKGDFMKYVARIHLKTGKNIVREDLVRVCLREEQQYLAIGWSYVYTQESHIENFQDYYDAVKRACKRIPAVHNIFRSARKDDLFWTRDLDGAYWICRVSGPAIVKYDPALDIGAVVPVKAFKYGMEVPGQIKASFNRPRGGTSERLYSPAIIAFSQREYNRLSGEEIYTVPEVEENLLENLPDFELEELVISYIQLKEGYYVLSNSIAKKSTTIKIECEFIHRGKEQRKKAVVQVKGGTDKKLDALDYREYDRDGYVVYLYAPMVVNEDKLQNCIVITQQELLDFYDEYKMILPEDITRWEHIQGR